MIRCVVVARRAALRAFGTRGLSPRLKRASHAPGRLCVVNGEHVITPCSHVNGARAQKSGLRGALRRGSRQAAAQTPGWSSATRLGDGGRQATHSSDKLGLPALTHRCLSASKAAASVWPLRAMGGAVGASALRAARAMRRATHVRQAPMALALSRHTHTCGRRRRRREARRRRRSTKQAPVKRASDMPLPRTQSAYAFCSSLHFFSARFFMRWISAAEQTRSKHRQLRPGVRSHAAAMRRAARTHPPPLSSTPAGCAGPSHSWRQRCEAAAERSTRELCALSRLALRCSAPLRTRH